MNADHGATDRLREQLAALPDAAADADAEVQGCGGDFTDQLRLDALVEAVLGRFAELPALLVADDDDDSRVIVTIGLARLGPQIAGDELLTWVRGRSEYLRRWNEDVVDMLSMAAIHAVAAAGRSDDAPEILAAIPRFAERRRHEPDILAAAAVLEHPAALAPILACHASRDTHHRRITALALGLQGDRRALPVLHDALRAKPADEMTRVNTALAVALLDLDAVDTSVVEAAASPWTHRIATWEEHALARAFALRKFTRRLQARAGRPTGALAELSRIVADELAAVREAEATALRCYRGRGATSGIWHAWLFLISDLHAAARGHDVHDTMSPGSTTGDP